LTITKLQSTFIKADGEVKKYESAKLSPSEFFKAEYSKFDDKGFPTHSKSGEEVTKTAKKKLEKNLKIHEKNHQQYLEKFQVDNQFLGKLVSERNQINEEITKLQEQLSKMNNEIVQLLVTNNNN